MIKIGDAVFTSNFFISSVFLYISGLCTLISFAGPYWSQSYPSTGNEFKNIGLWEACFYRYRHWKDDNQKPYTGCFWFWSPDMIRFRDWLMPCKENFHEINSNFSLKLLFIDWFIAVQFFACFGLIFIFVVLAFLSVSFMTKLRFRFMFIASITGLSIIAG